MSVKETRETMIITQSPLNQEETIVIVKIGAVVSCSLQHPKDVDLDALRERIKKAAKMDLKAAIQEAPNPGPVPPKRLNPKGQGKRRSAEPGSILTTAIPFQEGDKVVYQGTEYTIRRSYVYKDKYLAILMPGNRQVSQSKLTKK